MGSQDAKTQLEDAVRNAYEQGVPGDEIETTVQITVELLDAESGGYEGGDPK